MGTPKVTPLLEVRKSKIHGKGVFAGENIDKGVLLCVCPVLLVPVKDPSNDGILGAYYYEWSKTNHALVLGSVSLVNHSYKPNAKVYTVNSNKTCRYTRLKVYVKAKNYWSTTVNSTLTCTCPTIELSACFSLVTKSLPCVQYAPWLLQT